MLPAGSAIAQDDYFVRDRYTSVQERAQPDYDPVPIRLGAFEADPELRAGVGYRSNLFAEGNNEVSDGYFLLAPSVGVQSTWSRHEVGAQVRAEHREYIDTGNESSTDLGVRVFGRADATSQLNFTGSVFADETYEPRSSAARVLNAAEPVEVKRIGFDTGANYEQGRLQLRAKASAERFDFRNVPLNGGGTQDQSFRDNDELRLSVRGGWAVQRDWAVFGEVVRIDRDYNREGNATALDRDATGTIVRVGTDFELPALLRGDIAVGYQNFEYDDARVSDVDGVSIDGQLEWFVTELMTITGNASRRVVDPGLLTSTAAAQTSVGVRADYELRRNWLVHGGLDFANYDFESIDRSDDRVGVGVGTTWKLNRNAWLDASYRFVNQDSNVQSFDDNRLLVAIKLFP